MSRPELPQPYRAPTAQSVPPKRRGPNRNGIAIEYLPISSLKINPKNPKLHDRRKIKQIRRSIRAFSFCIPPVVDQNNVVICGAARIIAAQEEGLEEIPVVRLEHLTEAQATGLMLADNKLAEKPNWDPKLLGEVLHELSLLDLSFDIEATGFAMAEIDLYIEGLSSISSDDTADILPESGPPVSKVGDLWLLGQHRLLCGSAIDAEALSRLMSRRIDIAAQSPISLTRPENVPQEAAAAISRSKRFGRPEPLRLRWPHRLRGRSSAMSRRSRSTARRLSR